MSLRRRALNIALRLFGKWPLLFAQNPFWVRQMFECSARLLFRTPPFALYLPIQLGSVPALDISVRHAHTPPEADKVVFHIHGGAFIAGSPDTHRKMLARLSKLTGMRVIAPKYRLAPEHPFPAGLEDVLAAFSALCETYNPADIILGGDSAGGNLALALLAQLSTEGRAPAGVYLISPLSDMTFSAPSYLRNKHSDVILPASRAEDIAKWYLAGADPANPQVSPVRAQFGNLPPVFLQYSQSEILQGDNARLAQVLEDFGANVQPDAWDGLPHVWVLFDGFLPEARQALTRVANFIAGVTRP